ncbi:MAG: SURF1 family protein [Methylococcaceae bacterium]|nr:SURF1 family protein [Methylococcaceae bacterium]
MPAFCALGVWQVHRAEYKRGLMSQQQARERLPPRPLPTASIDLAELRYLPVTATGSYDGDHQFLLDNQVVDGRPGFRVLTPLRLASGDAVLVNRGWVPQGKDRSQLPALPVPAGKVTLTGHIDRFPAVGFRLKGAEIPAPGWPALVQLAEAEPLTVRLGYRLQPYQVLLAAGEPGGFLVTGLHIDLRPETSQGYALQWFSFAAATLILYLWYGFKGKAAGKSTDTAA